MPPLPRLRIPALVRLRDLLFESGDAAIRPALARIESLALELEPGRNYPEGWLIFAIAGAHPPDAAGSVVPGDALVAELSSLAEHLSGRVADPLSELERAGAVGADSLADRWSVSRKTVDRFRRRGLIGRRAVDGRGRVRLAFLPEAVERFERARGPRVAAAGAFTRISNDDEARMIRRAARYRRRFGCSLSEAAARLARRFGRSHEAVRQLLRRHDAAADLPIFGPAERSLARRRAFAYRALRRGAEPHDVAERLRRTSDTVVRLAVDHRAGLLRAMNLHAAFDLPRVEPADQRALAALLEATPVVTDLGHPGEPDLAALLRATREPEVPLGAVELARARAYRALIRMAATWIGRLPDHGAPGAKVDQAETWLLWAARLKAELVRSQLGLLGRTLESRLGARLDQLRSAEALRLVRDGLAAISASVDQYDPGKGGRLAAPAGLALSRVASRHARRAEEPGPTRKATPRATGAWPIDDWTLCVSPWQAWLEPDPRLRHVLARLTDRHRAWLASRYGWDGGPPRTLTALSRAHGLTPRHGARVERAAYRSALAAARAGADRP